METPQVQVLTKADKNDIFQQELKGLESELYKESVEVAQDSLAFREIDPDEEQCPPEWIEKYGRKRALARFRTAKGGWMSRSEAPAAIDVAGRLVGFMAKARAMEKAGPRILNMTMVEMAGPVNIFPVMKVDK
jgi:hypothetical protein